MTDNVIAALVALLILFICLVIKHNRLVRFVKSLEVRIKSLEKEID